MVPLKDLDAITTLVDEHEVISQPVLVNANAHGVVHDNLSTQRNEIQIVADPPNGNEIGIGW